MSDRFSAKHRMFLMVRDVTGKYKAVWQTHVAFGRAVDKLNAALLGIDQVNAQLKGDNSGTTESKNLQKAEMARRALKVSGALLAYAAEAGLVELAADAAISKDTFNKAKDADADDLGIHVWNLGSKYLTQLADYGITTADLDQLKSSIATFTTVIGQPRFNLSELKGLREEQKAWFEQGNKVLIEILDNLIHQFEDSNKVFFDSYQSARSTIRSGSRSGPLQKQTELV